MRTSATYIASLLVLIAACGEDEAPRKKTSNYQRTTYQPSSSETVETGPFADFVDVRAVPIVSTSDAIVSWRPAGPTPISVRFSG